MKKKVNIQNDIESRKAIEHNRAFRTKPTKIVEPIIEIVEPKKEIENGNSKEVSGDAPDQDGLHAKKTQARRGKTEGDA